MTGGMMSNRQIFLIAVALGFVGGFSWVATAQHMQQQAPTYASVD